MEKIIVVAEHRNGQLRDGTWEAIGAGKKLAESLGAELECIIASSDGSNLAQDVAKECPKVLVIDDPLFEPFNSEALLKALPILLKDYSSYILLLGNSNSVLDLAPGLSVYLDAALATDCFNLEVRDGKPIAMRQAYAYKVNTEVSFKDAPRIVITLRSGSFPFTPSGAVSGAVEKISSPISGQNLRKRFTGYVETEKGDVDIASAEIIISLGRGIGEEPDMSVFESLADTMGGVLACSRPIVDKNLLPKYHQVGTSGIEVKPKVYLALGISGAFQHVGGIKGAPLIVAVNKDGRAPIFRVAQYGIVGDVYDVVPALEDKIKELKK